MLNDNPDTADVTVIVPVPTKHVGCIIFAEGVEGAPGTASNVIIVGEETQLLLFFAVKEKVPGSNPVKSPVVFV